VQTLGTRWEGDGQISRDVSRETVRLYKKYAGRGPTTARTYLSDDLVVTVLHETLTQAEKTLSDADRADQVREQRRVFQESF